MTFNDAIKYFGSRNEMMEQLEVSKQVVSNWSKQPDKPLSPMSEGSPSIEYVSWRWGSQMVTVSTSVCAASCTRRDAPTPAVRSLSAEEC